MHLTAQQGDASIPRRAFVELMAIRGGRAPEYGEVTITGGDPIYPTVFKIGETCAAVLAAIGVAVSDIWELRVGRRQHVGVSVRHAAGTLRTQDFTWLRRADGVFEPALSDPLMAHMRTVTQPWPTKDGRWFLPHFNLAHLSDRVLRVLDCDSTPESVRLAVAKWNADELEDGIAQAGGCGGTVRTNVEWTAHPQGRALAARPVIEIERIGDSEPEPLQAATRPLSGIRVLDLTRILAGPVSARTLAEHGAEVLMVTAPHLPQIPEYVRDTSHGKRSCFLDLGKDDQAARLRSLVKDADVFVQGYRPGAITKLGFGPEQVAQVRPGVIYLSISCFGSGGPFDGRGGWEQVAQAVTGICHENGRDRPALILPAACDWTTGYLGAYGVLLALARRSREGGSYHVRVSLCQSGMFIYRQGTVAPDPAPNGLTKAEIEALQMSANTAYGSMRFLRPVLQLSETEARWESPAPMLGADAPCWHRA